ncbi:UDP-N-acetylglucosamine pyrophosphorylase [Ascosphaera acerosa]|nr:UDP-N-acetylglucosamine pyrophosphorylase [Ascosphaera acerosa]
MGDASNVQALKEKYAAAGQGHVFSYYDSLPADEQATLAAQLAEIDPEQINALVHKTLRPPTTTTPTDSAPDDLAPLPEQATASLLEADAATVQGWHDAGLALIAAGKVAVVLMAGGQGTRLGSAAPKGCYNIGLPSGKSLFQIQAERIARLQVLARQVAGAAGEGEQAREVVIPWYVMTSGPTRGPTQKFFEDHEYFGLDPKNVFIFEQGVLPCISNEGKILMESRGKVAVAPDGNGGIYAALVKSGARADMQRRGIEHVHAYCVDNCLVKVADPVFVGFAAAKGVSVATKVVRKRSAAESVGLIVAKNGRPAVVEYSEIDAATAQAEDAGRPGVLRFRAANIVNHYYSLAFLASIERWAPQLQHHVARKKIPHLDTATGETVKPAAPNGVKFEQFVFDVFPTLALDEFASLEVRREDEFSPLKNARGAGEDDPDTSRADIMQQGAMWVQAAGGKPAGLLEVSPAVSYAGEGLEFVAGKEFEDGAYVSARE